MQLQGHRPMRIVALILGLVALASCSTLPTTPAPLTQNQLITKIGGEDTPITRIVSLAGSKIIDGSVGGVLIVGKWKVVVPPAAYIGVGTITISVPDTTVDKCNLSIYPSTLNHFLEPVDLRFRCATLAETEIRDMRWWNPTKNAWVTIESWPNDVDLTRCAPLMHFSTYASGKAGW